FAAVSILGFLHGRPRGSRSIGEARRATTAYTASGGRWARQWSSIGAFQRRQGPSLYPAAGPKASRASMEVDIAVQPPTPAVPPNRVRQLEVVVRAELAVRTGGDEFVKEEFIAAPGIGLPFLVALHHLHLAAPGVLQQFEVLLLGLDRIGKD